MRAMKQLHLPTSFSLFLYFLFFVSHLSAQECSVEKESLRGSYTGACKKGKAHGKGKAVGVDTYEGDFKNGFPDGEGTYTWSNGNVFKGHFTKGLREGQGELNYKLASGKDSMVTGFWKKDAYVGKYEKEYSIYFRSKMITELDVEYKKDNFNQVTVYVSNTSGGGLTASNGELPKLRVDEVVLVSGSFAGRLSYNLNHVKKTESIIADLNYPVRMKIKMGSEEIEIEFREQGSYVLNVFINQ